MEVGEGQGGPEDGEGRRGALLALGTTSAVANAAPGSEVPGDGSRGGAETAGIEVRSGDGVDTASDSTSSTGKGEARKATVLETHGYTVGETIGSGSYATVKVAKSENHDCKVAVKIVSKFQAPIDYLRKFLPREIEVVKGLRHPNVMRFLQAIETTHRVYIVMEYAANGSLLDVIRHESHIDEVRARRWFGQLTDAVQYCHDLGIVHRDIKCENLLMDGDLNIKLSDFGFARGLTAYRGESASQGAHLSETFCGSYAYASPEILRGVPYQPQLADIWSMGVVLYAIVFGRLPFDDSNFNQLLKVQSRVGFPDEPRVSSACKSLIRRILAPARARLRLPAIRVDAWLTLPPRDATATATTLSATPTCASAPKLVARAASPLAQDMETVKTCKDPIPETTKGENNFV